MIPVTKPFLPPVEEYTKYVEGIWERNWLTNNGPLVNELEQKLKHYLGVKHFWYTTNGTVVLQLALKALNICGEVITTPFSYVATTNAIIWENCTPVFVDIKPTTFCIDEEKIEAAITEKTQAILATHVYGLPCNVERIGVIAEKYNLKVIYDGAHAFGATYKGKSILSFGDISTCSFHATKLFHTIEGGCIICNDDTLAEKLFLYRSFGHIGDDYFSVGINAKNSEFHAAMGLAVLPHLHNIIDERKKLFKQYEDLLPGNVQLLNHLIPGLSYNYAYFPVLFSDEGILLNVQSALAGNNIFARRYFYPSLNNLPFLEYQNSSPISEDVSARILCLPLYVGLQSEEVLKIVAILKNNLST